jgi:hypothetical protein
MIKSKISDRWRGVVFWGNIGASALIGLAGLSLNYSTEILARCGPFFRNLVIRVQDTAPVMIVAGAVGILALSLIGKRASDARLWRVIHKHLDDFQEASCDEFIADHRHKVTLFEHRSWYWCWRGLRWNTPFWTGWLVPVERSGTRNISPKIYFLAPKNNAHRAEGVAGMGWLADGQHLVLGPLKVPTDPKDSQGIIEYAKTTKVSEKVVLRYLTAGRPLPCSFFAHVIEVNSSQWGVLVVDSDSKLMCPREKLLKHFRILAPAIERLLSEEMGARSDHD